MRPIVTEVAWSACLSVFLSVCHNREPCANGRTDRGAVWCMDSGETKEPCISWGPGSAKGSGKFLVEDVSQPVAEY